MFIKMLRAQCVLNSEIHLLFTLTLNSYVLKFFVSLVEGGWGVKFNS